jgi:hypothetical protein
VLERIRLSNTATGTRFLTFHVRSVRHTNVRMIKHAIANQGAAGRRDEFRGVSMEDIGSIRARERVFTGIPQISIMGEVGGIAANGSPSARIILAKLVWDTQ